MVSATPNSPESVASTSNNGIRIADPDIIIFDPDLVPIEVMTDLVFENIGGQEIINIARTDLVNGQDVIHSPIKNLAQVFLRYNPQNILALQDTSDSIFNGFPIKYADHVPSVGSGPNGNYVYIDQTTGDIVVEAINLRPGYQIEIQVASSINTLDDTIYIEGVS